MRISDWSSDVCSSDLFVTKRDFAGLEVTASEQLTEQGDGNIFRVDATIGANFDDGSGNAVLSVGYQQADAIYQGARPFSVEQVDSYSGGTGGRSEEHTSELQSLMRISYAVFCLKKKTIEKTKNDNNDERIQHTLHNTSS